MAVRPHSRPTTAVCTRKSAVRRPKDTNAHCGPNPSAQPERAHPLPHRPRGLTRYPTRRRPAS
eukprot:1869549-Alexandrium_andersonii.AAC.1